MTCTFCSICGRKFLYFTLIYRNINPFCFRSVRYNIPQFATVVIVQLSKSMSHCQCIFLVRRIINVQRILVIALALESLLLLSKWSSSVDKNLNLSFHTHLLAVNIEIWRPPANYVVFEQLLHIISLKIKF